MKKEDFINRITEIGTCTDDVNRRELLTQLREEVEKDYDNLSSLEETNKNLSNDNETLRDANMKLFLRVGAEKTDDEHKEDKTGVKGGEKEKRSFDNLFDEKGALK